MNETISKYFENMHEKIIQSLAEKKSGMNYAKSELAQNKLVFN